jgi:hypothetical protein
MVLLETVITGWSSLPICTRVERELGGEVNVPANVRDEEEDSDTSRREAKHEGKWRTNTMNRERFICICISGLSVRSTSKMHTKCESARSSAKLLTDRPDPRHIRRYNEELGARW